MASPCEVIWPKIILYGDSITQRAFSYNGCFGMDLANDLIRKADVLNRGFGGYNTRWNKILLPRLIPARDASNIHLVIIFLGANDCVPGGVHAVPLDEFRMNLVSMLDYLMSLGIKRDHILLIDNPVTSHKGIAECDHSELSELGLDGPADLDGDDNGNPRYDAAEEYAHACVDVAKKWRVGYIELFDNMAKQPNWKAMLIDGVHFTHIGAEFLYKLMWPWVSHRVKDLPTLLPACGAINWTDPEKSLTQGGNP